MEVGPGGNDDDAVHTATDTTRLLLGTAIRVTCMSATVGAAVDELLGSFPSAAAVPPARHFLVVDGCGEHDHARCAHDGTSAADVSGDDGVALSWLLTAMNRAALDGFAGLAVHAAVLAAGGEVIALPAPSGTGKTTLTAAGLLAGFGYVSDEALCIEAATGALVTYPRALALSAWSRSAVGLDGTQAIGLDDGEVAVLPGRLGASVADPPLEVAHVVSLERRPGPSVLVAAERAEALTWLIERSFNHYKDPARSFEVVTELARRSSAWRLECGDPLEAAALLRDRLG